MGEASLQWFALCMATGFLSSNFFSFTQFSIINAANMCQTANHSSTPQPKNKDKIGPLKHQKALKERKLENNHYLLIDGANADVKTRHGGTEQNSNFRFSIKKNCFVS